MRRVFYYASCIMTCALLAGCNTDEICYRHPHEGDLHVTVEWTDAPEAHCEGVRVWVYDEDGKSGFPTDVASDGGNVTLREGDYMILAHNNDTEWIKFDGQDSYHSHVVMTRDANILEPLMNGFSRGRQEDMDDSLLPIPGERVAAAPEPIYGAGSGAVHAAQGDVITLAMSPLHCNYTFEFRDTGSLRNVYRMSAAISGMAESATIHSGELSANTVTFPLEASAGDDDNSIVGSFNCYGHHDGVDTPHRMALYVVMKSGKQYKFMEGDNLDVTSQLHGTRDRRNVHIVVSGIRIPEDDTPSEGSDVGWDISL